ncbi:hypothetical protein ABFS83_04G134200 [Erythranthe nasuta]
MESQWEEFVIILAEDDTSKSTPLYKLLIQIYPLQFLSKLLDVVDSGSTNVVKIYASELVQYHLEDVINEHDLMIGGNHLNRFKEKAMSILQANDDCVFVKEFGQAIVSRFLGISLENNQQWTHFEEIAALAIIRPHDKISVYVLDILANLSDAHRVTLFRFMKPLFTREHHKGFVEMLKSDDERAFIFLPALCDTLSEKQILLFMEAATSSSLFWREDSPSEKKCLAAAALAFCLRHFDMKFSSRMILRIKRIIRVMLEANDDEENRVAIVLCAALLIACFP